MRSHETFLAELLGNKLQSKKTLRVLDLGGGAGSYWFRPPLNRYSERLDLHIVDAVEPGMKLDATFHKEDVLEFCGKARDGDFDVVVAFDLVEHLPKHLGLLLLYEMERISSSVRGIYTPNGFLWQPPDRGETWNSHVSGWTPKEIRSFGWTVVEGHVGLKFMYGPYASPTSFRNRFSGRVVSKITNPLLQQFPALAFAFSAWMIGPSRKPHNSS